MKRLIDFSVAMTLVLALSFLFTVSASAQQKGPSTTKGTYFVDQNGDGICDNFGTHVGQKGSLAKKGNGAQNGTGSQGTGSQSGKVNGAGKGNGTGVCTGTGSSLGSGTGVCDGTGPKGNINRSGKK